MNHNCLGASDFGRAISAEELAALAGTGCGCTPGQPAAGNCGCAQSPETAEPCTCAPAQPAPPAQAGSGCGCTCNCGVEQPPCACQQPQTVCCWQVTPPAPPAPSVSEGCCCKQSFRAALQVLCGNEISDVLDFTQAAFITDTFVAGTTLAAPPAEGAATPSDNLAAALTGTFRRFSPCSCDLLDVDAALYYPAAGGTDALSFDAGQVSICALSAVVIQAEAVNAEGDLTAEEVAARQFRRLKRALSERLNPCGACGQTACSCCVDSGECCCVDGVLSALSGSNLSRRVTLTAGWLALNNVELLGTVGNVLVLAADDTQRVYFVCATKVGFLG